MILGYARVSTDKAEQDISIEAQVQQLYAAGCERVIAERRSAFKDDSKRRGWDELLGLVASGSVSKVVGISLARLSRKGEDVTLLRLCLRKGVEVQLLDGTNTNIEDPSGKMFTGILSIVNEVDSMIKSINIKNGLNRRKQSGAYACGRVPYGYVYDGTWPAPHPENFSSARQLWERLAESEFAFGRVIRRHGYDWSVRGLRRWAENPMLRGVVNNQPDAVEALITWDEWQQAARLLSRRKSTGTRAARVTRPFTGLVRCSACGNAVHHYINAGKYRMRCGKISCPSLGRGLAEYKYRAKAFEVLRQAADRMATTGLALPAQDVVPEEVKNKRDQLEQLLALRAKGVEGLDGSIDKLSLELLAPPPSTGANWPAFRDAIATPGVLEAASDEELRVILLEFVDQIIYSADTHQIDIRLRGSP